MVANNNTTSSIAVRDLLKLPTLYRNRATSVDSVTLSNIQLTYEPDYFDVTCISNNKYTTTIRFYTKKIVTPTTLVKVYCDCPSFNFEFKYILSKNHGLIYEEQIKTPLKNTKSVVSGCKHIIKLINYSFQKNFKNNQYKK